MSCRRPVSRMPAASYRPVRTASRLGAYLAERLCAQIRAWDRDRTAQPAITAYPARTPDQDLADGVVIDNQFVRLVVSG